MEKRNPKRTAMVLGMVTLVLILFSSEAFPWGFATHAYINDHLGKKRCLSNSNEIYGGMAPDVFNFLFDYPDYMLFLTYKTHADFMEVWDAARWGLQKPLAYGFVSHSVSDLMAHGVEEDHIEGYAIVKAGELLERLPPELAGPISQLRGLIGNDQVLIEMLHIIVENAVDILVKRNDDHLIGRKLISAALLRSPELPLLMVRAYASDLASFPGLRYYEAAKFIISAEREFRKSIILYGQILMLDEPTAIQLISEQTAEAAIGYLSVNGIDLNGVFQEQDLVNLAIGLTNVAISICGDYRTEIQTTINFVDNWLNANGVSY